jgi:hypothetical protein
MSSAADRIARAVRALGNAHACAGTQPSLRGRNERERLGIIVGTERRRSLLRDVQTRVRELDLEALERLARRIP